MPAPSPSAPDPDHRDLRWLKADHPDEVLSGIDPAPAPYVALLIWHAASADASLIRQVVEALLASGCTYLCAWGDDCERVHDIADEVLVDHQGASGEAPEVMTTWHAAESIEEALGFFLTCTAPMDDGEGPYRLGVVVSIGASPEVCGAIGRVSG
jgi:hypothetical protein